MESKCLKPKFENMPHELKQHKQWVVSRAKDKAPINPTTGGMAKVNKPETWGSFEAAKRAYESNGGEYNGVGFVFTDKDNYVFFDNDDCWTKLGINKDVQPILQKLNTYSEISVSGRGTHSIAKIDRPLPCSCKKPVVEIYYTGRYCLLTGHRIPNAPQKIKTRTKEVMEIHKQYAGSQKTTKTDKTVQALLDNAFRSKNGDKIRKLFDGEHSDYDSQSEADLALCNHLAFFSDNDFMAINKAFRQSKLYRKKWDKPHYADGSTYGERTIEKAIQRSKELQEEREAIRSEPTLPAPDEKPTLLVFPKGSMAGVAGQFARLYGSHLEPPEHFFFMSFLTCLGSALSNRLTLTTEVKPQPRLYTILLGESADDRKSTAIEKTVDFFKDTLTDFSVCFGIGSAEGLQRKMEQASVTLLVLDEFKHFVGKCKIQNSVLLPCVNTFFESNRYESWTAKREVFIPDGYLSLLAASTLQTYENVWAQSFTDIGFNNRLFLVPGSGRREYSFPEKIPDHKLDWVKQEVGKVMHHASYHQEIDLTDNAKKQYHQWYMDMPPSIHAKRIDAYALRIMSLMAVNEMKDVVDEDILSKTLSICDWQLEARQMYDPVDADNEYAKMEEKIRRVLGRGPRTDRELRQFCNVKRAGLFLFNSAKSNLKKAEEIGQDKRTKRWFSLES